MASTVTGDTGSRQPGALLGRVPGKPISQSEAMRHWQESDERFKPGIPDLWRRLLLPEPTKLYRWWIALGCGCVWEEWTSGDEDYPDTHSQRDPLLRTRQLRKGERHCRGQHPTQERGDSPYRRIVEWFQFSRKIKEYNADPIEPPDRWAEQPDLWAIIRHSEPHKSAFWEVRLDCGHCTQMVTDEDFRPTRKLKVVRARRLAEMKADWADFRAEHPDRLSEEYVAHHERMLSEGFPTPPTETTCFWCGGGTSMISAYQRIGWLDDGSKPKPAKPRDQVLREQLAFLKEEEQILRAQLSKLESDGSA